MWGMNCSNMRWDLPREQMSNKLDPKSFPEETVERYGQDEKKQQVAGTSTAWQRSHCRSLWELKEQARETDELRVVAEQDAV